MRLLELTPAEIAFLAAPPASGGIEARLTQKLAVTLSARLRLPVHATVQAAAAPDEPPAKPSWQPDSALATLWLTRRLGGQRVAGVVSFIPPTLVHTLDAMLAECWLDAPVAALPPALAWHITTDLTQATLAVQLPQHTTDMTRWARGVIRNG